MIALAVVGNVVRALPCGRRRTAQPTGRVLLVGAYGNGNYGDEAIGIGIVRHLSRLGLKATIGARDTDCERLARATGTPIQIAGSGFSGVAAALRAGRGVSGVILGGGGLLEGQSDSIHVHRLVLEYLGKAIVNRLRGISSYAFGIGVSEVLFSRAIVNWAVLAALRAFDDVAVRDRASVRVLAEHGIEARLVRDPAIDLIASWVEESEPRPGAVAFVGLDRLRWPTFDRSQDGSADRAEELSRIADLLAVFAAGAREIEFHPFHHSDLAFLEDLARVHEASQEGSAPVRVRPYPRSGTAEAFIDLASCERIMTMRFHPALAGLYAGRDVEIDGDMQKLVALREAVGGGTGTLPTEFSDPQRLLDGWLKPAS